MLPLISHAFMLAETTAQATDPWANTFFGLDPEKRFVLMIIGIGCATGILIALPSVVLNLVGNIQRHRINIEFKREMLDRGMSADEISKVIESTPLPEDGIGRWFARRPADVTERVVLATKGRFPRGGAPNDAGGRHRQRSFSMRQEKAA